MKKTLFIPLAFSCLFGCSNQDSNNQYPNVNDNCPDCRCRPYEERRDDRQRDMYRRDNRPRHQNY